jgi:hypothetical protein
MSNTTDPKDVQQRDLIEAAHVNYLIALSKSTAFGVSGGFGMPEGGIAVPGELPGFWIRLTGVASGAYAWTEAIATGPGAWADGPRSGTTTVDAALEVNTFTLALPTPPDYLRVPAERSGGGAVIFQYDTC